MADTIFGKIIAGDIPAELLYEDEHCIAINDISPKAPLHVLVIPKKPIPRLVDASAEDQALLGHLLLTANKLAEQLGVAEAFNIVVNNGADAGQTIFHLHVHLLAGRQFGIVGGEDQSATVTGLQLEKLPDHGLSGMPVKTACRFIGKNQVGIGQQRTADGHPLALATGELLDIRLPGRQVQGVGGLVQFAVQFPAACRVNGIL